MFKRQIECLSTVLQMLLGKSESELSDDFAFSKVIAANIELMFDAYEYHQFGIEHPRRRTAVLAWKMSADVRSAGVHNTYFAKSRPSQAREFYRWSHRRMGMGSLV